MRECLIGILACALLSAQDARSLYNANCAGCHGPNGEGSRGPALRIASAQRTANVESLIELLRKGVPGTEMPAFATQLIAEQPMRALARYVMSLRSDANSAVSTRVDRGAALFRGKGKCLDCHRVAGEGSTFGPDLTDIGRARDPEWLRRSVAEPEAGVFDSFVNYRWTIAIPDNYLLVEAVTSKGERITGSRVNEDAFSIQVRDRSGRLRSFLKSELSELTKHWGKSPMPSYADVFSNEEVEDVVAYLASLRGLR